MRERVRASPPRVLAAVAVAVLTACGGAATGDGARDRPAGDHRLVEGHGPEGEVPLVDEAPVTLTIDGEDWGGTAACNRYGGTVRIDSDRLTVREVIHTEMGCLDERIMASERRYLDALSGVERYEWEGDRLVLIGPDTELRFEAVPPAR